VLLLTREERRWEWRRRGAEKRKWEERRRKEGEGLILPYYF